MSEQVALVTGANKGIGIETVRQLAQLGYTVILASRDAARGEAAAQSLRDEKLDVQAIELDVGNADQILAAVKFVDGKFGHLDALVNNAGVGLDWGVPASTLPRDVLRATFDANFFGAIAVTQAFLPLLRKSPAGRIVNVSSILGSITEQGRMAGTGAAYGSAKSALNSYTVHLASELKKTTIKVNAAHPGWVKTDLGGHGAPLDTTTGAKTSVRLATLPADGPTGQFFHLDKNLPW